MIELQDVLDNIELKLNPTIKFRFRDDALERWLQVEDTALPPEEGRGRKWNISQYATRSEIVQTALMAFLAYFEHEARESFRWRGEPIFSPHYDVEALHALCVDRCFDVREPLAVAG